jgi:hypothetical protein
MSPAGSSSPVDEIALLTYLMKNAATRFAKN